MKNLLLLVLFALTLSVGVSAQTATSGPNASTTASETKPKRQIFRATKDQIQQAQTMLKSKNLYTGEATGKLDDLTRASLKAYQKDNGLKETGTMNRATLEKMGIELTDAQKAIPASSSSAASSTTTASADSSESKPKRAIFRATKDQIVSAQTLLKTNKMYDGEASGKLDDDTRAGLKKYQEANGLKVTGTLNQVTLEKMGIELTDKQKETSAAAQK